MSARRLERLEAELEGFSCGRSCAVAGEGCPRARPEACTCLEYLGPVNQKYFQKIFRRYREQAAVLKKELERQTAAKNQFESAWRHAISRLRQVQAAQTQNLFHEKGI